MQAVIFDLDGTIVFSHPTHFEAYQKLFSVFGITWTYEEFNSVFAGTGAPAIIRNILERNGITNFDLPSLVNKKRDIFNELMRTGHLQVVPGFYEFLEEINRRGLKKTIASGSHTENIRAMLANIGVADEFPIIVSGAEVALPKPAPDIFLLAAEKIGVSAAECLVLEDTTHGVIAAKLAGMMCYAFTTTTPAEKLRDAGADKIFADYNGDLFA